ncbi:MAG: hypothetical protein CMJ75_19060 [Planctomycetaceae bacterium]|nr:hypothetical protein [Planctomycetaceae bacterium]
MTEYKVVPLVSDGFVQGPEARETGAWESARIGDFNAGWNACRDSVLTLLEKAAYMELDTTKRSIAIQDQLRAMLAASPDTGMVAVPRELLEQSAPIIADNSKALAAALERVSELEKALSTARYRVESGRVWGGMGWTLTGLHASQQQKVLDVIDAALAKHGEASQ